MRSSRIPWIEAGHATHRQKNAQSMVLTVSPAASMVSPERRSGHRPVHGGGRVLGEQIRQRLQQLAGAKKKRADVRTRGGAPRPIRAWPKPAQARMDCTAVGVILSAIHAGRRSSDHLQRVPRRPATRQLGFSNAARLSLGRNQRTVHSLESRLTTISRSMGMRRSQRVNWWTMRPAAMLAA
jgi:hypothetical protein